MVLNERMRACCSWIVQSSIAKGRDLALRDSAQQQSDRYIRRGFLIGPELLRSRFGHLLQGMQGVHILILRLNY
jgi:hypothetical protein